LTIISDDETVTDQKHNGDDNEIVTYQKCDGGDNEAVTDQKHNGNDKAIRKKDFNNLKPILKLPRGM